MTIESLGIKKKATISIKHRLILFLSGLVVQAMVFQQLRQ